MTAKRTHEEFLSDLEAVNTNVVVLEKYLNGKTPLKCKCRIDGHVWYPRPKDMLRGKGCPKCYGNLKLTETDFLKYLISRPDVRMVGEFINARTKLVMQCTVDGFEWSVTPRGIMSGRGCPKCANNMKKSQREIVDQICSVNKNIEMLDDYVTALTSIRFKCLLDGHVWNTTPVSILSGSGCPKCAGNAPKTHDEFIVDLCNVNPKITVIGSYLSSTSKLLVRCNIDQHEWFATPRDLLRGHGCPKCSKTGYKTDKRGVLYVYKFLGLYGYGKTNNFKQRHKNHITTFNKLGVKSELLVTYSGSGKDIEDMEKYLKTTLPKHETDIKGFKTESVDEHNGILLFRLIDEFRISREIVTD